MAGIIRHLSLSKYFLDSLSTKSSYLPTSFITSLSRHFSSNSSQSQNLASPSNLTFEYVQDLSKLSSLDQEYLINETYKLFSTSLSGLKPEDWEKILLKKSASCNKIMLIKENKFKTYVGFSFYHIYDFYYKEEDKSNENRYVTSNYYMAVMPNFRGGGLGRAILESSEYLIQQEYKNCNRASFNITLNPFYYNLRSQWTQLMVPGNREMPNKEPEKLLQKIFHELKLESFSPDKPYVIFIENACIHGAQPEKYLKKIDEVSEYTKFFINQTCLKPEYFLANLAIYNLVPNNTLGVKSGIWAGFREIDYKVEAYKPRF